MFVLKSHYYKTQKTGLYEILLTRISGTHDIGYLYQKLPLGSEKFNFKKSTELWQNGKIVKFESVTKSE